MPRLSVFFKVTIGFLVVYTLYTFAFNVYYIAKSYRRVEKRHAVASANYSKLGKLLLKYGEIGDLQIRLAAAVDAFEIDYFMIRENGEEIALGNAATVHDGVLFPTNVKEGVYDLGDYRHFVVKEGVFELIVGYKTRPMAFFWKYLERDRDVLLKDISFVPLMVLLLVLYGFRDIRIILSHLTRRGQNRGDGSRAFSREAELLLQGLRGYESKIRNLSRENALLKGQVLPALQSELWSGKTPPYDFNATMARTDINNFTTLFSSQDRMRLMAVINEFFVGVTHIVSRYKGFVYEFVGDEVIFYFRDEDHENSAAAAISAIRDINKWADEMNERTLSEFGYQFRVKSSLSYGVLRFGELVNGYSLAGNPLIETVRILSHIHEKSENTVFFAEEVRNRIGDLCRSRESRIVVLKGLGEARRLYAYESHVPLIHHLRQGTKAFGLTTYYRDDSSITEILEYVRQNRSRLSKPEALHLLSLFKRYRVTRSSNDVRKAYLDLMDDLLAEARETKSDKAHFALSTLVSAGLHLFTSESFFGRLRERFLDCLELDDHRTVANTVDVFSELEPEAGEKIFQALVDHSHNRVAANAVVKEGRRNWNSRVARQVRSMLRSRSLYFKASGLYALGEIARYLKQADEVAFHADRELHVLLSEAARLAIHSNRMVRRQSINAMRKTDRLQDLAMLVQEEMRPLPEGVQDDVRAALDGFEAEPRKRTPRKAQAA